MIDIETGIIIYQAEDGSYRPVQSFKEWEQVFDCEPADIPAKVAEHMEKGYLARFGDGDNVLWIVNPRYERNGHLISRAIWDLFRLTET